MKIQNPFKMILLTFFTILSSYVFLIFIFFFFFVLVKFLYMDFYGWYGFLFQKITLYFNCILSLLHVLVLNHEIYLIILNVRRPFELVIFVIFGFLWSLLIIMY